MTLPSGWLVGWQAKANVPNVGGSKNFNFFARGEKIKIRSRGLVGEKGVSKIRKNGLVAILKSRQFEVARSQNRVSGNVLQLGAGGAF